MTCNQVALTQAIIDGAAPNQHKICTLAMLYSVKHINVKRYILKHWDTGYTKGNSATNNIVFVLYFIFLSYAQIPYKVYCVLKTAIGQNRMLSSLAPLAFNLSGKFSLLGMLSKVSHHSWDLFSRPLPLLLLLCNDFFFDSIFRRDHKREDWMDLSGGLKRFIAIVLFFKK